MQMTQKTQMQQREAAPLSAGAQRAVRTLEHSPSELQRRMSNHLLLRQELGAIQAKLVVSPPDDQYEQEADRVADAVMRMPEPVVQRQPEVDVEEEEEEPGAVQMKPVAMQTTPLVQRQAEEETPSEEEEEESIQTKSTPGEMPYITPEMSGRIYALLDEGQPLPEHVRSSYELRFGYDFSQVSIHTDDRAAVVARQLRAQAFTLGKDMVFGSGRYAPDTEAGRRLLAHELTHVVQQRAAQTGCHIQRKSFEEAISKFKKLVEPATPTTKTSATEIFPTESVSEAAQFYCTNNLLSAVSAEIAKLGPLAAGSVGVYRDLNEAVVTGQIETFKAKRHRLLTLIRQSSPSFDIDKLKAEIGQVPEGAEVEKLCQWGYRVYKNAWDQIKAGRTPELRALAAKSRLGLTLAGVLAVYLAEKKYCGSTATRVGQIIYAKKGTAPSSWGVELDLWNKSNMPNKIERIKWAIDLNRGTVVHVRVLSPYLGKEWEKRFRKEYDAQMERWKRGEVESKPKPPKPHHSIVLIGYAGNQFLFWDPDAATTAVHVRPGGPPERGFGLLQYEASEQLLWAPAHRDHYRVVATWKGR